MPFRKPRHKHHRRRRNGLGKVKRDIKWLKQNIEFKFGDFNDELIADTAGEIDNLNTLQAGTGISQRVGEEVTARRIMVRGRIHNDRGTPSDGSIRLILFRQKAALGTLATASEILEPSGTVATNRMRQMDNKEDIVIYADHTLSYDTLGHSIIDFKLMFKLASVVKYTGTAATIPQWNAIGMFVIGSQATTANAPGVSMTARFSYVDS